MTRRRLIAVVVVAGSLLLASPALAGPVNTKITSGPSSVVASTTVSFKFSSEPPGATFQCKLDDGAWSTCASPKKYTKLAQGEHTFRVRARRDGAVDPTPAVRTWRVDSIPPDTTITSGPSGNIEDSTPTFVFGSSGPATFQCRLTSATFSACTSPFTPVVPLVPGTYVFEVRAQDAAGNVDTTPATRSFNLERALTNDLATVAAAAQLYFPDDLVIDVQPTCDNAGPGDLDVDCPRGTALPASDQLTVESTRAVESTGATTYDVTITSDVDTLRRVALRWGTSVECGLGFASAPGEEPEWTISLELAYASSPSPRLSLGEVQVKGVELHDWGIERWDPAVDATVCGRFPGLSSDLIRDAFVQVIEGHLQHVGAPLCAAPGPAFLGPCDGGAGAGGGVARSSGAAAAGATGPAAAAPDTTILSGPTDLVASRTATFTFRSLPSGATFQCRLDDGAWTTCASPKTYSKLAQGAHTYRVRARKDGVVDPTPATATWTVDTVPPDTTLVAWAPSRVAFLPAEFAPTASDGTVECRVDAAPFAPCGPIPWVPELIPDHVHTAAARARDAAGNADPTPATSQVSKVGLMPNTQELGDAVAAHLFPDLTLVDVAPNCPNLECPGGTPNPPSDQLSIATTNRAVAMPVGANRFDVTATVQVVSLQPIHVAVPLVGDCTVTLNSGNGATPAWTVHQQLNYVLRQGVADPEASLIFGSTTVTGVENDDVLLTGNFGCQFANLGLGFYIDTFLQVLSDVVVDQGPICMAPGPALFERCPWASEVP